LGVQPGVVAPFDKGMIGLTRSSGCFRRRRRPWCGESGGRE
jgi:hypothetical protein